MKVRTIVLLGLVHTALASIASTKKDPTTSVNAISTVHLTNATNKVTNVTQWRDALNEIEIGKLKTRRKKYRSTSSSSGEKGSKESRGGGSSLGVSSDGSNESGAKVNKYLKYQNFDAKGWRRWHRKCTPCPEDMVKKWRDPTIKWICGGYQRARRSFKSKCMMHYRNCQDGTMFVKIHDHRCENSTKLNRRGQHFFYDYKVDLPDDSTSGSKSSETSPETDSSSSESEI